MVIPDKDYFDRVQAACKKYGTVFIIDEVATGFGRTGKLFASEHYRLQPDIFCLAKGLTGGYGALGATLMTEELSKSMNYEFSFYSTFGWHPLNVHAAQANLDYLLSHKKTILDNVGVMSRYFEKRLTSMRFRYPTEIRIKGLTIGLASNSGYMKEVVNRCLDKGLLISELDPDILTMFPALTIDKSTVKKGLDIFESCL